MKFFILGDSWGLGEYNKNPKGLDLIPNTGIDYYLKNLGHWIVNKSAGGSGNFGQLRNAYWKLKESSDYDYIIWFHTEPIRDIVEIIIDDTIDGPKQYPEFKTIKDLNLAFKYVNDCNYNFAQNKIYAEFKIPWIVVGGVGRLEDSITNFSFAQHKIYSWPEEILGLNYKLPRNQMHWHRCGEMFVRFVYDKQQVVDELDAVKNYQKLFQRSQLFPDDMHVTRIEYEKLANRILKML
jgi:hypothetical protein